MASISIIVEETTKEMKMKMKMKMKTSSYSSPRRLRPLLLLSPSSLSKNLPLFTITESLYLETAIVSACYSYIDDQSISPTPSIIRTDLSKRSRSRNRSSDILTKAPFDVNSEVEDNKDEEEAITSITAPTNNTTRQQDHFRLLHRVSRWDANCTSKSQGLLFDPTTKTNHHRPCCYNSCSNKKSSHCNNDNIIIDHPPISPIRRRTRKQLQITVAPVA
jgi:hypothetical protein